MQMPYTHKFMLSADPEDAAGHDVSVPITFTVADTTIATLEPVVREDGTPDPKATWVVAVEPGSTTVGASVPTVEGQPDLAATLAVDVLPGGVATVELVAGEPVAK